MELAVTAIASLLPKLDELLKKEYGLQKHVKKKVETLSRELSVVHAVLRKISHMPPDQLNELVRLWARDVREASYDMEDITDTFLLQIDEDHAAFHKLRHFRKKVDFSSQIQEIYKKLVELAARRDRYKIVNNVVTKSAMTIDPRVVNLYKGATKLVGIEGPKDELIDMLSLGHGDHDVSGPKKMKIVSVVGFGGLGKTTLAKVVYDQLKPHFNWGAFIPVGRNPNIKKVLRDILIGLDKEKFMNLSMTMLDEKQLMDELMEFVKEKRCFIVIDDIWDKDSWKLIRCALQQSNYASRLLITTRISEVATHADEVYKIQPLSHHDSENLLFARITDGYFCSPSNEACELFLKKCSGVPLSIDTIACVLASKPWDEWSEVYNSIGFGHKVYDDVDNTRRILSFSYYDLPSHLKVCLLYLGVFPENYIIQKNSLIWMWLAEGFISEEHAAAAGVGLFELGERYFYELINRNMIQAQETKYEGYIDACSVHNMVLDLIHVLSSEENFFTVLNCGERQILQGSISRRLALQCVEEHNIGQLPNISGNKVRSIFASPHDLCALCPHFPFLRVVHMAQRCSVSKDCDQGVLDNLWRLLHLRYLRLADIVMINLSREIRYLRFLQTLDLDCYIEEVPEEVGLLTELVCLRLRCWVKRVPVGLISKLTSLQELCIWCEDATIQFVKELGLLRELRVLDTFFLVMITESIGSALLESLGHLPNIQELQIISKDPPSKDWVSSDAGRVSCRHLRALHLGCFVFSGLPTWINSSLAPNLSYLDVQVVVVKDQDMETLAKLPGLSCLILHLSGTKLVSIKIPTEGVGYFCKLRFLKIFGSLMLDLNGSEGKGRHGSSSIVPPNTIMPSLESLEFDVYVQSLKDENVHLGFDKLLGFENLGISSLQSVTAKLNCEDARIWDVEEAEAALKHTAAVHPKHPTLVTKRVQSQDMMSRYQEDISVTALIDMAMESPITASLGSMAPLLRKVNSLKLMAPCPSDDDIKYFKEHLEVLCRDLLEPEETSSMPKWWRKEVRELLYDTEDRLDKFILLPGGDFSELIAGVEDAYERHNRLKLALNNKTMKPDLSEVHASCLTPDESTSHKLSMPISAGSSCIVGLDELTNKLIMQLAFDDHNQKGLKVVPILGFPGVGETTAARTFYHQQRGKFRCSAFVHVSRTPDVRSLLISILLQIKAPWLWAFPEVHNLIDGVKEYLKGKMYFIILDGLWTASVWDVISRAFPDGNYGSRIVTTTHINDVALACCRYYPDYIVMSPLNDDQSKRLLFTIVFGSENRCLSDFNQVSDKIIKKCAGLPLAIVNVANLLRRGSELSVEKWELIQESLPSILGTNRTTTEGMNDFFSDTDTDTVIGSEGSQLASGTEIQKWKHTQDYFSSTFKGLKQVLMFIYNNLPPHLKTCLLYLSMYPEGYLVRKHDVVRQWVAEGFINAAARRSAEESARDYFDELVCSGIVQPVDNKYGREVLSCTVHHMVLDLIRHKSKEMNFIITVDHLQSWLALPDQVRRLSIQFGGSKSADIPENIEISKLRSLLFCGFIDCVPSVVDYEFLRVLILDIWTDGDETEFDLTRICELLRLRYLKIQCNLMVNLPDEISRLKYLETLEVDARLSAVPSDIGHLEKLLHLLLPSEAILPQGHGSLQSSLLTLGCFDLNKNSSQNVIDLAELTNLQDLRLTCSTSTILSKHLVGNMKHLALILGKLNNLRSLALNGAGASSQSICDDGLSSVSPSPALLEKLELRPRICTLSRIPKWIGELSRLTILKIEVVFLSKDEIAILEELASLTALSLRVLIENVEWIFEKGFPALRYFKFVSTSPYLSLLEGAMPNVQKLKLAFNANILNPEYDPKIFGFKHLTSLTEVTVKIGGANADESSKGDTERVLKDAFSNNPSSPILNVQWVDCTF